MTRHVAVVFPKRGVVGGCYLQLFIESLRQVLTNDPPVIIFRIVCVKTSVGRSEVVKALLVHHLAVLTV